MVNKTIIISVIVLLIAAVTALILLKNDILGIAEEVQNQTQESIIAETENITQTELVAQPQLQQKGWLGLGSILIPLLIGLLILIIIAAVVWFIILPMIKEKGEGVTELTPEQAQNVLIKMMMEKHGCRGIMSETSQGTKYESQYVSFHYPHYHSMPDGKNWWVTEMWVLDGEMQGTHTADVLLTQTVEGLEEGVGLRFYEHMSFLNYDVNEKKYPKVSYKDEYQKRLDMFARLGLTPEQAAEQLKARIGIEPEMVKPEEKEEEQKHRKRVVEEK